MSPLARVLDEREDEYTITAVEGEIDASNVAELAQRLRAPLTNRSTALIVDLTRTSYVDSAGINLLFGLDAELRQRQQRLHLVVPAASPIARMMAITGLDSAVAVHESRQAVVEHLGGAPRGS